MARLNITWAQFAVCNDNPTKAFEDMCRQLFTNEFLKDKQRTHSDHNNPGIEVLPISVTERKDGIHQKKISFQCKYVEQPSYAYTEFQKSAKKTVEHYKGDLDRVYLFCNKTLTTTASGYKSIVKIYEAAGIETVPISNDELLDMVNDYPDVAEYFFQPRIVADTTGLQPILLNGMVYMVAHPDATVVSKIKQPDNQELLEKLVTEKLSSCHNYAMELKIDLLKEEVEKLFSFGADDERLYYYQLLILLHEGKETNAVLEKCDDESKTEAKWLISFYRAPKALSGEEFQQHPAITQVFILDKLFTSAYWREVIALHEKVRDAVEPSIGKLFDLFYGLSLLNLQENEKAMSIFHSLYERTGEPQMWFYETCAEIRIENVVYQSGMVGHHEKLAELLARLEEMKDLKQYTQQGAFVTALKMETAYHLGINDKSYLERVIEEFDYYPETIRTNTIIQCYYALCLELNGNQDRALKVYEALDWKTDSVITERYMICLVLTDQPGKAIKVYDNLMQKSVRADAIYLLALDRCEDKKYRVELKKAIKKYSDNLSAILQIAYFTDSEKQAKDIIIPAMRKALTEDSLTNLRPHEKTAMLTFLAHFREIEMLETVLDSMEDIAAINNFAISEICNALFDIANREYVRKSTSLSVANSLVIAERIADNFLVANVSKINFLQIKMLCSGAKRMPYSFLKYSKELFEITHDAEIAQNIVVSLYDRKETRQTEYSPYLEVLEKSNNPEHCMVVACAMLIQGKNALAEFYAYKALYLLNGEDNYQIYQSYFSFFNYNLYRFREKATLRSITGSVVVMLKEDDGERCFEICLDPESDFSDETNRSMCVEHLIPSNPNYVKLGGCGLGQVLHFRNGKYKIVQILPRSQYALNFILRKIQEKPEMFKGTVQMIFSKNTGEMINQIKDLTDNSAQIKSLLAAYHFKDNEIGLPIESVGFGDYSRYIAVFKYLLYQKDEALYAGAPIYENETGQEYVPGLATLVLLAVLGRLDVLEAFKQNIIVPESYISFFKEEYSDAAALDQNSPPTLCFVNGKPIIMEHDKSTKEIWENILRFCQTCRIAAVTDQERIDFTVADGVTGEWFVSSLRLNVIHLDALLLAKRENLTFLCDDLFFRKLATGIGIRNLNIVSLVQHYTDLNYTVPIIKELSKTNYVYIPLLARNDDEFSEILGNITNGKKKAIIYGDLIQRFMEVKDRVLREYFGDEYIDQIHKQNTNETNQ